MRGDDGRLHPSIARSIAVIVALFGSALLGTGAASAADDSTQVEPPDKGWGLTFSPGNDLYPRYIADPRRSMFSVTRLSFSDSEIPAAGNSRIGLRAGGRYGLVRFHREQEPDHGFQVDVEGGFLMQFDADNHTDNVGWDGLYGLQVAWAGPGSLALRLGVFHDSSHIGDEYAESTGRTRIEYTRQEYLAGLSWQFHPRWRGYAEGGWAFDLRNEVLMDNWRGQAGLEFESPVVFWNGRAGLYVAADASFFQEDDWERNLTIQTGLVFPVHELARTYRVGVEFYDGRSHIGEFFQHAERYYSLGLWFEL